MNGSNDAQSFAANFIHASQKVCSVCRQHVYPYTGGGVSQYQCIIVVDYGNKKSLEGGRVDRISFFIFYYGFYYWCHKVQTFYSQQITIHKFFCPPIQGVFIGTGAAEECLFGGLLSETCGLISC